MARLLKWMPKIGEIFRKIDFYSEECLLNMYKNLDAFNARFAKIREDFDEIDKKFTNINQNYDQDSEQNSLVHLLMCLYLDHNGFCKDLFLNKT